MFRNWNQKRERSRKDLFFSDMAVIIGGIVFLLLVLGVIYLRLQQNNHALGEKIKIVESELARIRLVNSNLEKELARLKAPASILKRAEFMDLNLMPTQVTQIVRMPEVDELEFIYRDKISEE